MKYLFLHCCCGPCACHPVDMLASSESVKPILFFDNPNIYPDTERTRRLENLYILANKYGLKIIEGRTPHSQWLERVKGLESEPEKGKRCSVCFRFNLELAQKAMEKYKLSHNLGTQKVEFEGFATTLTLSRFKNSKQIFESAKGLDGFVPYDFKKNAGEQHSAEISALLGLYRQKYCGCEFCNNSPYLVK